MVNCQQQGFCSIEGVGEDPTPCQAQKVQQGGKVFSGIVHNPHFVLKSSHLNFRLKAIELLMSFLKYSTISEDLIRMIEENLGNTVVSLFKEDSSAEILKHIDDRKKEKKDRKKDVKDRPKESDAANQEKEGESHDSTVKVKHKKIKQRLSMREEGTNNLSLFFKFIKLKQKIR
jgi:hypothetical protein